MGYVLSLIGLGLMVGLSGAGSAWGLALGGSSVLGMVKKKPEAFGTGMVLAGLPATQGLYGFVAFIIYSGTIQPDFSLANGAVVLGAGLAIGIAALFSAIFQGKVCASGITAMGSGHSVFGNTMILAAFPEFYAILALVAVILMQGLMQ
ncbi:MAG: ATPase [Deltaproteobacteria bacterium]|nr:ATPase [Deltaproteobacteria bacterium]MBT4092137.1 ATPase [Deltaproteobacteria bacterium]MBT4269381.1 ATPase [Deltaproteobacteria bacterium]MBT4638682.1 ATPase [Deltaproteobacteria bacterium]MBT6501891.1 ATPase [Deltaproteobacteria bacterium]